MSYTPGTDLGRVREMLADTNNDEELFTDTYLNDLLSLNNSVEGAAVVALRRILVDPELMRKKFQGYGSINLNNIGNFIRIIEELIKHIMEGASSIVDASSSDSAFPEADQTAIGRATDDDGWWERSTLNNYLLDLRNRR